MRSWRDWSWADGNFWDSGVQPLNVSHMSDDQLARVAQIVDALTVEIEQEYMDRDDPADD